MSDYLKPKVPPKETKLDMHVFNNVYDPKHVEENLYTNLGELGGMVSKDQCSPAPWLYRIYAQPFKF